MERVAENCAIFNDFSWFSKKKNVHNSTPRALKISSLAPLESAWKELSNGDKLELRSCCGVEIWRKDFLKIARFFAIFRDFLRRKTFGQLHHGHLRYRAWYRWKACRKSFPTVLSSTSNVGVVQKIQWKNRRKSRAFGGGATLFLCEKSFVQRKKTHAVEATLSFNIRSIIFLKLRVARGMYTLWNPFNSRKTDENRALLRFLKVQFWAQKVNIAALNSKVHYVRVSSL